MDEKISGNKRNRDAVLLRDISNVLSFRYDALKEAAVENEARRLRLEALKARKKPAIKAASSTESPPIRNFSI